MPRAPQGEDVLHQLTQPAVPVKQSAASEAPPPSCKKKPPPVWAPLLEHSRCFIASGLLQDQLASGVHREDPAHGHAHLLVGEHVLQNGGEDD